MKNLYDYGLINYKDEEIKKKTDVKVKKIKLKVTKVITKEKKLDETENIHNEDNNMIDETDINILDNTVYMYNLEIINRQKKNLKIYNGIFEFDDMKKLVYIMKRKINDDFIYVKRLHKEFNLIKKFRFEKVFFQVYIILCLAGEIPHIIRGSAGSCLLCYLMGITDIDPIKENIALSRFMHKDRKDIPDIDIDFPSHKRDQIYKKIFENWKDKVARISNHIIYKEKSALREAIRQEGYRKFVPKDYKLYDFFEDGRQIKNVEKKAHELMGTFRCHSLHCGGIVIFDDIVPKDLHLKNFEIGKDGFTGSQIHMNKDEVEDNGMIKIDILSNRGLSQLMGISDMPLIKYPINDKKTFDILKMGNNIGITHSESRAMMKVYMTMKPETLKEIAISLALIRPAAAKGGQKSEFLSDYTPYKYYQNEYIIFDDDATLFIKRILNCEDAIADNYRRAFSKGKEHIKNEFKRKLQKIITDDEKREKIENRLDQLSYYSFCKSHAFSYAQLVVALAYHKAHNPHKFWFSTLNNCNSSYRKWVHVREAVNSGLNILPGSRPFKMVDNTLIPNKKEKTEFKNPISQFINYGYWVGKDFLPNMYYEEYWVNLTKRHKEYNNPNKSIIIDNKMKYAKFKGIIATGRGYKKEQGKGYLTFVTISCENGVYTDIILYGYHKLSKMRCISGYGKVKNDKICTWIEAVKFENEWITQ